MTHPNTTNLELVARLGNTDDQQAWTEFVQLYEPLILQTAARLGLSANDAVDAAQEVFVHLANVLPQWTPTGRKGAFRSWLRKVARNLTVKLIERTTMLKSEVGNAYAQNVLSLTQEGPSDESTYFNIEFRRQVFLFVAEKVRSDFSERTWRAFWHTYLDQLSPMDVAKKLKMSVGAVYIARSRVMHRLQSETKLLVNEEWLTLLSAELNDDPSLTISRIRETFINQDEE